jgi:hypothetical protein
MIVCCEDHKKYTNIPCQQNSAFLNIKVGGIYLIHCVLKLDVGEVGRLLIDTQVLPH